MEKPQKNNTVKGWALVILISLILILGPLHASLAQGLFEQALAGEESSSEDDLSGSVGGLAYELNGYVRGDIWVGRIPEEDQWEQKAGYGEASLKLRLRKGDAGGGFTEFRLREGDDSDESEVREAYINLYSGPLDLRFGQQIILWGRADKINPTNNLTPYDMRVRSPDEDDRRLGNLGMRAYLNFMPFRLEGVWMPTYAESHLPEFEIEGPIDLAEPDYPGNDLSGGVSAIRLNYEAAAIDWSISYLDGYAPFPGLELRSITPAVPPALPTIEVGFRAYRHTVIGADFSTTVRDWFGLRGEAAYKVPSKYDDREYTPMPELHYVVGVDREFVNGDVFVILQYLGKYVYDWDEIDETDLLEEGPPPGITPLELQSLILDEIELKNRMLQSQQDEVSHSVMTRIQYKMLQETLSLELVASYNLTTSELLLRPVAAYDIADALTVTAGGEYFQGPDDTFYGMIDYSQSAAFVELKASF